MQILFKPGQEVKKSQPLFVIDPRPYQATLDQAQAQLAHDRAVLAEARTDLVRYQHLAQTKAVPEQQAQDQEYVVEQDQGTVKVDEANVEAAKLNLEYCHIASPIEGRVGMLLVDLGNYVQSSGTTSLANIAQIKPIYVNFPVPQTMFSEVQQNQAKSPLNVIAHSQSGKTLGSGKLTILDNQVNTTTRTVTMQATFPNDNEALWPGAKSLFRRETLSVPVEPDVATLMTSYHGLNHLSAKTPVRRRVDGWTSRLSPAERKLATCHARPLDTNLTFRRR